MKHVKLIKNPNVVHHPDQLSKGYPSSAAHDLYLPTTEEITLYPNESRLVNLGISIHINDTSIAAEILPRSGTGSKGLVVGNLVGLIDQDYQGEIHACLWNRTDETMKVDSNKAVAQLVFKRIEQVEFVEVTEFDGETERGAGGFGSSDNTCDATEGERHA